MPLHHLSSRVHARTMTRIFDEHRVIFGVQSVIFGVWSDIFGVQGVIASGVSCVIARCLLRGVQRLPGEALFAPQ